MTTKSKRPPWRRANPKKKSHTKLSPAQKTAAKKRARKAGRPYPNLVDNMRAASRKKKKKARRARKRSNGSAEEADEDSGNTFCRW